MRCCSDCTLLLLLDCCRTHVNQCKNTKTSLKIKRFCKITSCIFLKFSVQNDHRYANTGSPLHVLTCPLCEAAFRLVRFGVRLPRGRLYCFPQSELGRRMRRGGPPRKPAIQSASGYAQKCAEAGRRSRIDDRFVPRNTRKVKTMNYKYVLCLKRFCRWALRIFVVMYK